MDLERVARSTRCLRQTPDELAAQRRACPELGLYGWVDEPYTGPRDTDYVPISER